LASTDTFEQFGVRLAHSLGVRFGRVTLHIENDRVVAITTETRHKPFEIAGLMSRRFAPPSPEEPPVR
jgi:hypothetical protein